MSFKCLIRLPGALSGRIRLCRYLLANVSPHLHVGVYPLRKRLVKFRQAYYRDFGVDPSVKLKILLLI